MSREAVINRPLEKVSETQSTVLFLEYPETQNRHEASSPRKSATFTNAIYNDEMLTPESNQIPGTGIKRVSITQMTKKKVNRFMLD